MVTFWVRPSENSNSKTFFSMALTRWPDSSIAAVEKAHEAVEACLDIGERLVVVKTEIVEILEKVEDDAAGFLGVTHGSFEFEASPLQFRIGQRFLVKAVVIETARTIGREPVSADPRQRCLVRPPCPALGDLMELLIKQEEDRPSMVSERTRL